MEKNHKELNGKNQSGCGGFDDGTESLKVVNTLFFLAKALNH